LQQFYGLFYLRTDPSELQARAADSSSKQQSRKAASDSSVNRSVAASASYRRSPCGTNPTQNPIRQLSSIPQNNHTTPLKFQTRIKRDQFGIQNEPDHALFTMNKTRIAHVSLELDRIRNGEVRELGTATQLRTTRAGAGREREISPNPRRRRADCWRSARTESGRRRRRRPPGSASPSTRAPCADQPSGMRRRAEGFEIRTEFQR
jgi:hypothetical protein